MSEHVRVERDGGVLAITLARPERRNAITVAMYAALADAIESAAGDDALRLITLARRRRGFHRRQRPRRFHGRRCRATATDIPVWRLLRALASNQMPIVAAVHGNAVGIGTTMLLHCDLVVAEEGTRFMMPFVDLGLVPEAASSLLLPRLAGRRRAARYLLLGEPFGADEALRIRPGQPCRCRGRARRGAGAVVAALLAKPAEALRLTQKLLRRGSARRNPRADGAGERPFRRAAEVGRGQGRRSPPSSRSGSRTPA